CGHPVPLISTSDGVSEVVCVQSVPLGLGVDPVITGGTLTPGDRLLLYTDGLIEARDSSGRFIDLTRVTESLSHAPLNEVLDDVLRALDVATGGLLNDDLALLVAEYR
ncbi:MAG: serine/threonine-protein phosphatase, partial [Actinomycetota bacterium]|nr:serine/threonine-protein phosphatase [Actinomycetota bacterium]